MKRKDWIVIIAGGVLIFGTMLGVVHYLTEGMGAKDIDAVISPDTIEPTKKPDPQQVENPIKEKKPSPAPVSILTDADKPTPIPEPTPTPEASPKPSPTPEPEPELSITPIPIPEPSPKPSPIPEPDPVPTPIPAAAPDVEPVITEPVPTPEPTPTITPTPSPTPLPQCTSGEQLIKLLQESGNNDLADAAKTVDAEKLYITRQELARILIDALGDQDYPEFLDAYKGLIADFGDVGQNDGEYVLKAVYTGAMGLDSDGAFKPKDSLPVSEAAEIIANIKNPSGKDKIDFAEPDDDFEAFMDSPEADEYVTTENIYRVTGGKVIFDSHNTWGDYGHSLLPVFYNRDSNRVAYDLLKGLVSVARKHGHYVGVMYNKCDEWGINVVVFSYFKDKKAYTSHHDFTDALFNVSLRMKQLKDFPDQETGTYYLWEVRGLFDPNVLFESILRGDTEFNFQQDEYKESLETAFKKVYGDSLGQSFYDYTMDEYNKETEWNMRDDEYQNTTIEYRDDLGGIEVANGNKNGSTITFSTGGKKQ